jgi:hypothetical protein
MPQDKYLIQHKSKNVMQSGSPEATVTIGGGKGEEEDSKGMMDRFADRMNGALMGAYYKLGYNIGSRPRVWAAGTLVICLLLSTGIFMPVRKLVGTPGCQIGHADHTGMSRGPCRLSSTGVVYHKPS